ncbi:hypothetical protein BGZ47_005003 [Haplosporangium gracile]|nr:hypothetical protein BGZ47_005003 [Haplosporangium gracile]
MESCIPVSATVGDTTSPPPTATTPLALAVAASEATSTAITSTSVDMSLTTSLESSCILSDPSSPDSTVAATAASVPDLHHPSPSSSLIVAAVSASSCYGGCSDPSSIAGAGAPTVAMTTIHESSSPSNNINPNNNNSNNNNNNNNNNSTDKKKKRRVVRIDIYSDTTCPWCYLTKKRLEKAIQAFHLASSSSSDSASIDTGLKESTDSSVVHGGCSSNPHPPSSAQSSADRSFSTSTSISNPLTPINPANSPREKEIHFDIHWQPFQLDPNAPREPIRKSKMYHRKFGTEKALQVRDRIVAAGKAEGVTFLYTDQSLYSNTINSHRMIRFARERLGRLPLVPLVAREEEAEDEGRRKMVDSGNALDGSHHSHAQHQKDYFPTYISSSHHKASSSDEEEEEEEEVDEWGARMEDAMVDELFRSHFERGECSEFKTLISCARSVLLQTAAFSAAAAAALTFPSASSLTETNSTTQTNNNNTNTNESTEEEHTRLLKAKEQELIDQQLEELDLYLHSDAGLDEVMEEIRVAKEDLGMQGVPMIVIQNEYLLSGAQTANTFVQVLQRVI